MATRTQKAIDERITQVTNVLLLHASKGSLEEVRYAAGRLHGLRECLEIIAELDKQRKEVKTLA